MMKLKSLRKIALLYSVIDEVPAKTAGTRTRSKLATMNACCSGTAKRKRKHKDFRPRKLVRRGVKKMLTPYKLNSCRLFRSRHSAPEDDPNIIRVSYQVSLKGEEEDSTSSRGRFDANVSVTLIPSYRDYSPEECEAYWTSEEVLERDAESKRMEFEADGGDWKECCTEDDMVIVGGKLVHPYTYARLIGCTDEYQESYFYPAMDKRERDQQLRSKYGWTALAVFVFLHLMG